MIHNRWRETYPRAEHGREDQVCRHCKKPGKRGTHGGCEHCKKCQTPNGRRARKAE